MGDVPKTEQNIDTSMGYTGTLSAGESENADLYLSEFSESISQTTDTESHYTIPKILLEPPPSPSKESTRGITAEDLSHVPYRNGYLSTEFLYSDCCIGQHDLMISNDKPSLLPPTDSSVQLPCRYQRRLQEDLENCNVSEDDSKEPDVPHDDMSQREEDLGTALKWIRQEIVRLAFKIISYFFRSESVSSVNPNNILKTTHDSCQRVVEIGRFCFTIIMHTYKPAVFI